MDIKRCIAVTRKKTQCTRNKKPNSKMFCPMHSDLHVPKEIIFKNIMIKTPREDEYEHLQNLYQNMDHILYNIDVESILKNYNMELQLKREIEAKKILELEKQKIDEIDDCKCCYTDEYEDINLIRCSKITSENKHKICIECLKNHLEVQIKDCNVNLECVFNSSDNCAGEYDIQIIRCILEPELFEKYNEYIIMSETKKLASIIDNYQMCPKCMKYGIEMNVKEKAEVKCLRCGYSWCNLCKKDFHTDHCYVIKLNKTVADKDFIINIDNTINDIKSKKTIHECPHCSITFIKTDGCNLMLCTNCKGHSCYICGIKIFQKSNSYYHNFKGHALNDGSGKCDLFNNGLTESVVDGNYKYNNKEIIKEYDLMLDVNKDEKTRKLLYDRIKISYGKEIPKDIVNLGKKYSYESTCNIL